VPDNHRIYHVRVPARRVLSMIERSPQQQSTHNRPEHARSE
jgi:hypothetical protein